MVRTLRDAKIDTPSGRAKLSAASEPHWLPVGKHRAIGYAKPAKGAGTWRARFYRAKTAKFVKAALGLADDHQPADGVHVFNFQQAQERADKWFQEQADAALREETGEVVKRGPYTVADAVADFVADIQRRGRPHATVESYSRTRILPVLGEREVGRLTKSAIEKWHLALAESPRWKTGRGTSEKREEWAEEPTPDQKRARRNTANRILAILKRALTLAVENGQHSGATPWRDVKPFQMAKASRVRFLNPEEQVRLLNACPPDFRRLVTAALYTGSRYAPLTRLKVRDFDPAVGIVFIERDKGKGRDSSRHVVLTDEAAEWFKTQVAGKEPDDLIFIRDKAPRTTREGAAWLASDQSAVMDKACKDAKLERLVFHELRHTYASGLVNAGVPLAYVADQLGHKGTRMVEEFYGHLCPSAKAEAIRKLAPKLGLAGDSKVKPLKLGKRA